MNERGRKCKKKKKKKGVFVRAARLICAALSCCLGRHDLAKSATPAACLRIHSSFLKPGLRGSPFGDVLDEKHMIMVFVDAAEGATNTTVCTM